MANGILAIQQQSFMTCSIFNYIQKLCAVSGSLLFLASWADKVQVCPMTSHSARRRGHRYTTPYQSIALVSHCISLVLVVNPHFALKDFGPR